MTLSVVIPLYNHQDYIAQAIGSVLTQTRRVDRIIVVDDGSTDRSVEAVSKIDDRRIELVTQPNRGAHIALNRGIDLARGSDFVSILNSDDVYHPKRIEKCVGFLEKNLQFDVVCTRMTLIDQTGSEINETDSKARWVERLWAARRDDPAEWLGIANFAKTSSNFVARGSYMIAHPFRDYRFMHDYFFVLWCALDRRLGVLPEELLSYRAHPENTIKSGPPENVTREILLMNLDLLRELAPRMARSAELRRDYTSYFRMLVDNYADFRTEVFMQVLAMMIGEHSKEFVEELVRGLTTGQFPELNQSGGRALREYVASAEYVELQRAMLSSRWFSAGRVLGLAPELPQQDGETAEKQLLLLKTRVRESGWLNFGRKLGFVYF